jgi:hypothetical protein
MVWLSKMKDFFCRCYGAGQRLSNSARRKCLAVCIGATPDEDAYRGDSEKAGILRSRLLDYLLHDGSNSGLTFPVAIITKRLDAAIIQLQVNLSTTNKFVNVL